VIKKRSASRSKKHKKSDNLILRIIKSILVTLLVLISLVALTIGSIWVAGSQLFALNNNKNILFISSDIDSSEGNIYLAYFYPVTKEINLVPIESSPISLRGGYGEYELAKTYPLLTMEKKKPDFQRAILSWGVRILIDHIIDIKPTLEINNKKQLQQSLQKAALDQIARPQKFIELLEMYFFTRSVPVEQIRIKTEAILVDNLETLDTTMIYESCSVAVVNTTQEVGLASKMSEILEKSGVMVVRVTDQSSPYQLSTLSYSSGQNGCQALANRLRVLFPGKIIDQDNNQLKQEYRADMVVLIGKDLIDR
jgi:hypothetical protein